MKIKVVFWAGEIRKEDEGGLRPPYWAGLGKMVDFSLQKNDC